MKISIEELATFCKKKGFVFSSSDIYGGYSGFFDYGPLGVELKNNIKKMWWKRFVHERDDIYGLDGSIITNPKIWKASGHIDCFEDVLVEDVKTKERFRADHLIEDILNINIEGKTPEEMWEIIKKNDIKSPNGNDLKPPLQFNLMFSTNVGPVSDSQSYLRPETAQTIFANFRLIYDTSRAKLPFGIAQIGKAFRNEISPRDFLFRSREFEQMEIEYFIRPDEKKCEQLTESMRGLTFLFLSEKDQEDNRHGKVKLQNLIDEGIIDEWHAYWLAKSYMWFVKLGIKEDNLRIRQHTKDELSHYSSGTFDIDYNFPFGWKEIHGNADRGQFDLNQHAEHSKKKMQIFDPVTNKMIPRVIEPSFGVDRAFLAFLYDSYNDDKDRGNIVLRLDARLAPVQVAVFPLVNKLDEQALQIYLLLKTDFVSTFDRSGSVGKRYARSDEQGIPYTVTFDFDSLEDKSVTIRDRDSTDQIRVKIDRLKEVLRQLVDGSELKDFGDIIR